ncbi:unnamed protein product [Cuscuta campestris]|uniref:ACB domain-containing protein n=1 Tax=Cuscuta campestris TaxID=132261 RepID=A0A484KKL5_9ASTE|nr:unnamed protein product [Cuscuta campestris]
MTDWQQFVQPVFLGLIFSFLLAKLFSVIFSFRDENLRVSRSESVGDDPKPADAALKATSDAELLRDEGFEEKKEPLIQGEDDGFSEDDDWEGVESTELDEMFSAATAFVAATAADRSAIKVSNEVQLQLYGLYKIATEGPCSSPQPSPLKMTARAKWQAWQKLGALPPEEAMEKYIDIITELYPTWASGSSMKKNREESGSSSSGDSKATMGPVFSSFIYEEEPGNELKLADIHAFAREGDDKNLLMCIESGVPVDLKDSEGRTPLHWAVDRGHMETTKLLISRKANVNAKDNEGQGPLHYAAVCERKDIAEMLVKNNADIGMEDGEGNRARDLCGFEWPWLCAASE